MKMAMDTVEVQAIDLTQMLESSTKMMQQSVVPHIGETQILDYNIEIM